MTSLSLPLEMPYREMMAFFHPDKVELSMEAERLMQCPVVVRSWFDVLADEAIILPLDHIVFHYTLAEWERLCHAIGEFHLPIRHEPIGDEPFTFCGVKVEWDGTFRNRRIDPKGRPA